MPAVSIPRVLLLCLAWAAIGLVSVQAQAQDQVIASDDVQADLSSPRATLTTFLSRSERASQFMLEAYGQRLEEGGLFPSRSVKEKIRQAENLLNTAARTLDVSEIPEAILSQEKIELVLQLKEILERRSLPPLATVPDAQELLHAQADGRPMDHWRLPGTELVMVRLEDGTRTGDYVLTAGSVGRIPELYRAGAASAADGHTDIYKFYSLSPGRLLPPIWYEYLRAAPDWINATFAGQTVWQWIALAAWTLLSFGLIGWAIRQRWRTAATTDAERRLLHKAAIPAVIVLLSVVFLEKVIQQINLTGVVFLVAEAIGQSLRSFGVAWLIVVGCQAMAEFIVRSPAIRPESLDAHLLRTGFRVLGLALALLLVSHTATELGIPFLGVLAGLGVGGLAIALAAQPTIENFIGSVILFADRPVRVGEFCQCGDVLGTVEEIGLRSTRIRALDRTLVSIPNSEFSKSRIINFTRRDRHFFDTTVSVRFDAAPADLERLLAALRDAFDPHDLVVPETVRVRFGQIKEGSFVIILQAYLQTRDFEVFLKEKEDLLLKVVSAVEASGCTLAAPLEDVFLKYGAAPGHASGAANGLVPSSTQGGTT